MSELQRVAFAYSRSRPYGLFGVTFYWVTVPAARSRSSSQRCVARARHPVEYLESRYHPLIRQLFAWQACPSKSSTTPSRSSPSHLSARPSHPLQQGCLVVLIMLPTPSWRAVGRTVTDFLRSSSEAPSESLPRAITPPYRNRRRRQLIHAAPAGFVCPLTAEYNGLYMAAHSSSTAWFSVNWGRVQRLLLLPPKRRKEGRLARRGPT